MHKGVAFITVWSLTTLAWVLVGFFLTLIFETLSLRVFFIIGLVGGLFIASLLAFTHEDSVPAPEASSEPEQASAPNPDLISPGINPNLEPDSKPPV